MVHNQTLLLVHEAQELRGEKKFHIEGRILAHEDNIKPVERFCRRRFKLMVRLRTGDADATEMSFGRCAADREILELHVVELVPPFLGLEHQAKRVSLSMSIFSMGSMMTPIFKVPIS